MAWYVTRDESYAQQALDTLMAWARTNQVFGLKDKNGPLEAAW